MKRSLDKKMEELFNAIPDSGSAGELKNILRKMHSLQHEAVAFVAEKKNPEYHNLRARNLVENETFLFVGLLLLRDMLKDPAREALTERYIRDGFHDFERNHQIILSDDFSVIEKHRAVIDY